MTSRDRVVTEPLLEVADLQVAYAAPGRREPVRVVEGVSFSIDRGRTLGLVGESGSGKSTTGLALLRLVPTAGGRVRLSGERPLDVLRLGRRDLRVLRRRTAMVFQDPYASLDPRLTVGTSVAEPLVIHRLHRDRRRERVEELLGLVGLAPAFAARYPHQLSGGQRQRVGIARALAVEPELVVLDEPIASLDVSVQAQVMNLLRRLQAELGLTYLFIAHDLAAVRHVSDDVAVMHRGRLVEVGPRDRVYDDPQHPYTRSLLDAVPLPDPAAERERIAARRARAAGAA
ncbi:MAG: ATP-binding cassette domain-containing protein [Actinomycetota bacterium]|nr:ATP-binding cassette domain-containing protein [Actinomycetota bacterium]